MTGQVISINIAVAEGAQVLELPVATLITEQGIDGDRYCAPASPPNLNQISLVESEVIESFAAEAGVDMQPREVRRNIVTRDISLNDLVGKKFCLGNVEAIGTELAEPCKGIAEILIAKYRLEYLTAKDIVASLLHRGGLYARVLRGGSVRPGDPINVLPPA
ncbi:MAG: MOSC domain-containing protein [Gammaproteobacteria bacterium]|nr:MOSC domain-containing protein [Gammaproteobacteria bacterium]